MITVDGALLSDLFFSVPALLTLSPLVVAPLDSSMKYAAQFLAVLQSNNRSNQMAQHLATKAGFKKVWNVEGGVHAYASHVDSSVGVY